MDILLKKGIYFESINEVFDVFNIDHDWLFYRLRNDYIENGYIDKNEYLIEPCEGYEDMICLVKIYNVKDLESNYWIENNVYDQHKTAGTLHNIIDNIINNVDEENSSEDNQNNFDYKYSSENDSE